MGEQAFRILSEVIRIYFQQTVEQCGINAGTELFTCDETQIGVITAFGSRSPSAGCSIMPLYIEALVCSFGESAFIQIIVGDIEILMQVGIRSCDLQIVYKLYILHELLFADPPAQSD